MFLIAVPLMLLQQVDKSVNYYHWILPQTDFYETVSDHGAETVQVCQENFCFELPGVLLKKRNEI